MFLQQAFSNKVSKDTISDWFFAKSSGMCRQNTGSLDLDSFFMLEWFTDWWKTKKHPSENGQVQYPKKEFGDLHKALRTFKKCKTVWFLGRRI